MHMSGGFSMIKQLPLIPYIFLSFYLSILFTRPLVFSPFSPCRKIQAFACPQGSQRRHFWLSLSLEPRDLFLDWTLFGVSVRPISLSPHIH